GALGTDLLDGFNLGVKLRDGKLGGLPVEMEVGDDQLKPDVGRQLADRMVKRDGVDVGAGIVFSNVMEAIAQPVTRAEVLTVSLNAGPSTLAGAECSPYFFHVAWQNDNTHVAMGQHMQDAGFENVYLLAPNYRAGKDALD